MRIVVLAGGSDQIALINELKSRGHYVILVDYFDNPPARNYADEHVQASTLDVEKVRETVVLKKADLVCTACTDQALLTVADVSQQLGLPCYISYQTALNVTNKSYMKRRMIEAGIPTARFVILDSFDVEKIEGMKYPMVVKPVDCNSSKGVTKVCDIDGLRKALSEAIGFSRTGTAVIEEFKEGIEISADLYIEGDKARFLSATSSCKISGRNSFTILGSVYPVITRQQEDTIVDIASSIASSFGLRDCPLLIQMIAGKDSIDVIEFSARMGGGSKYFLIKELSGVDIMSKYVDLVLGQKPVVEPRRREGFCRMNYIYCRPGVFDRVEGFETLMQQGVVSEYFVYKTSGMAISSASTSGDRAAGYLVTADTEQELEQKLSVADAGIRVLTPEGEDIMIHNLS